jgi:hypothetical protein
MNDIKIHPAADLFPVMSAAELVDLGQDIKANGLRHRLVVIDEHGERWLLDGRNRYTAMRRYCPIADLTAAIENAEVVTSEPHQYVISANIHRRHLTAEQRKELAGKLLMADPAKSNRAVADLAKISDKTVAAVRDDLEARAEIPNVPTRTDSKGRQQPAQKKPAAKASPESVVPAPVIGPPVPLQAAKDTGVYDELIAAWDLTTPAEQERFIRERISTHIVDDPVAEAMRMAERLSEEELNKFTVLFNRLVMIRSPADSVTTEAVQRPVPESQPEHVEPETPPPAASATAPLAEKGWQGQKPPCQCNSKNGVCRYQTCQSIGCCQAPPPISANEPVVSQAAQW